MIGQDSPSLAMTCNERTALKEEPVQNHRDKNTEQHRNRKQQPEGESPLSPPFAFPGIGVRASALVRLHSPLVSRACPKYKRHYGTARKEAPRQGSGLVLTGYGRNRRQDRPCAGSRS